jgi:inner membrane transporter RhtA
VTDRPTPTRSPVPAEAFFVASALSLYGGAAIAVTMFERMPPGAVAWLRVSSAALILLAWRRPWRRRWSATELGGAAAFGIATSAMNLCFYLAADRVDLGAGVAVEFIGPVTVAALGTRTRRNLGSLTLAVAGVATLATFASGSERSGIAFALTAGALWGVYIVLGHRVAATGGGIDALGLGTLVGAVAIAPFGIGGLGPVGAAPWLVAGGAAVGLMSNVVPYSLDQVVLRRLPADRFALLLALLPATATAVGALLLGQVPSMREAAGIALIVAGIAVRDRSGERTVFG